MENWQVVAVVEIANLQRPRKKNKCRIPCLVHGEHSGQPVTRYCCLEVKYRTHVEAGFEVHAVCNLFIHLI